jgi:hypothetical protein
MHAFDGFHMIHGSPAALSSTTGLTWHIRTIVWFILNKTCRYCPDCNLLIAHQNELDDLITRAFTVLNPEIVGNRYLVIGTVGQADRKRIDEKKLPVQDTIEALHDFEEVVIFKPIGGWGR